MWSQNCGDPGHWGRGGRSTQALSTCDPAEPSPWPCKGTQVPCLPKAARPARGRARPGDPRPACRPPCRSFCPASQGCAVYPQRDSSICIHMQSGPSPRRAPSTPSCPWGSAERSLFNIPEEKSIFQGRLLFTTTRPRSGICRPYGVFLRSQVGQSQLVDGPPRTLLQGQHTAKGGSRQRHGAPGKALESQA